MCGIVGYVGLDTAPDGNKFDHNPYDVVIEGLRRQAYRGYDSAGVALVCHDGIVFRKKAGKNLKLSLLHISEPPNILSISYGDFSLQ